MGQSKKNISKALGASSPDSVSIAYAKAHFSSVVSGVQKKRNPITVLRRGMPIAQIVPVAEAELSSGYGWMRGSVKELGDIVGPTGVEWTLKDE